MALTAVLNPFSGFGENESVFLIRKSIIIIRILVKLPLLY